MGSASSKFKKALQKGEEVEAMQLYLKNSDIKRNLDPNYSYGENYRNNSLLHYACLYAMKPFVRDFSSEGANKNLRNSLNQTPFHYICMSDRTRDPVVDKLRAECLSLMLCSCKADDEDCVELGVKDHKNNTALHYAALSGLYQCVQILVANGVPLYEENDANQTACDCAIQGNFSKIASFLESKMVFSDAVPDSKEAEVHLQAAQEEMQPHRGLCAQDLQEAKDQLLVETADMLMVPLFTAEALLRDHGKHDVDLSHNGCQTQLALRTSAWKQEWSREKLVEAWMNDAKAACEKAGVKLPEGYTEGDIEAFTFRQESRRDFPLTSEECLICADDDEELLALSCGHSACNRCWERYLNIKIKEGDAHNIQCPALNCNTLVPLETIEKLVSREMASRYLQFDIKAFVESNPNIKWCPSQGCGRAVRLPPSASPLVNSARTLARRQRAETQCLMVDCGSRHYFCWHCLQEVHEPCTCELWDKWMKKIAEMLPKIPALKEIETLDECPETEKVANTLWLVTNSKPCPNCKSPIQKTEGCNHMKCSKCKHEFCWVCLELWKKHSSATGGYFRCNRYEIIRKLNIECIDSIRQASEENMLIQKLNYFLHYYSRFKNHENSFKLEEPLLGAAKEKMTALAMSAIENDTSLDGVNTTFVEEAVRELLNARRVLKASYAYGYFLENKDKKRIFEFMQTDVEEVTENLSQMVARPYLRTPRSKIIQATALLRNKRQTFLLALSRGVIPDEELPQRFVSKLESLSRVPTSSDDESDEGEDNYNEIRRVIESSIREQLAGTPISDNNSPDSSPGSRPEGLMKLCARSGCLNPRLERQYTGQLSSYCCYDCLRLDMRNKHLKKKRQEKRRKEAERQAAIPAATYEDAQLDLDLMRAIELSLKNQPGCSSGQQPTRPHSRSSTSSASSEENHAQPENARNLNEEATSLQKALELSYGILVKEPKTDPPSRQDQDSDLMQAIQLSLEGEGTNTTAAENSLDGESVSTCGHLPPDNESSSTH